MSQKPIVTMTHGVVRMNRRPYSAHSYQLIVEALDGWPGAPCDRHRRRSGRGTRTARASIPGFWAAPLLPEDPEWPTPTWWNESPSDEAASAQNLMNLLPRRAAVLCAAIAAEAALEVALEAESGCLPGASPGWDLEDAWCALALVRRWLSRRDGSPSDPYLMSLAARAADDAGGPLTGQRMPQEHASSACAAAVNVCIARPYAMAHNAAMASAEARQAWSCPLGWWRRWWSECRRALSFCDAWQARAEFEVAPPSWALEYIEVVDGMGGPRHRQLAYA